MPESDRYGIDSDGHGIAENWKQKAKGLKADVIALYYAYRDPRVPGMQNYLLFWLSAMP